MPKLPKYCTTLFNAAADAIKEMERQNYDKAKALLIQGRQKAEELCISEKEPQE